MRACPCYCVEDFFTSSVEFIVSEHDTSIALDAEDVAIELRVRVLDAGEAGGDERSDVGKLARLHDGRSDALDDLCTVVDLDDFSEELFIKSVGI